MKSVDDQGQTIDINFREYIKKTDKVNIIPY